MSQFCDVAAFLLAPALEDKEGDSKMAEETKGRFQFIDEDKELSGETYSDSERNALGIEPVTAEAGAEESVVVSDESSPGVETESEGDGADEVESESIQVGEKQFAGVESLKDAYQNLESLYGKQTNEVGDLRRELKGVEDKRVTAAPQKAPPEIDPYDPNTYDAYFNHKVSQVVDSRMKQEQAKETKKQIDRAYGDMITKFNKDHPEMSNDEKLAIARFADKRGIMFLEDAYQVMQAGDVATQAKKAGAQEVTEKLQNATQVPKTLSSVSGSPSATSPDIDRMAQREWNNLSDDLRLKYLQETPSG